VTRRLALVCALATAAVLAAPTPSASAADPAPSDSMAAAQAQAAVEGQAMPIDALTTETYSLTANPDGSFTSTTSLLPVRVRKDGDWVPVDATLQANPDGTYSPRATPHGVTLSGGGDGPLVTLHHQDGSSMVLSMPFTLPAPTVDGDKALYPSVLPDVDLSVSVTDQGGFSDVLVVHDAAAAADPRIRKLTLAASTDGLTLSSTSWGGMQATTADGTLDYTIPRPLMWDSGSMPATAPASGSRATAFAGNGSVTSAAADQIPSSVDGPGTNAQVQQVSMTAGDDGLTLKPDAAVLTSPDTTYPVYIDPAANVVTSTAGNYDEVYSNSSCSDSPQYDKPQTNGEGVGYQGYGGLCGNGIERSYYAINTSKLTSDMVVSEGDIAIKTTYAASWDCSHNQPITLHTTDAISSSTDWDSRPKTRDPDYPPVTTHVASGANSNSSCSNHTAAFDVTKQAQTVADSGSDVWTIGLYGNESSSAPDDYLRMSTTFALTVTFDIPPDVPTGLHTIPKAAAADAACTTDGVGWIGATTYSDAGSNVRLDATVNSNVSGENVAGEFHVWDRSVLDSAGNAADMSSPASGYLATGSTADVPIGFTLKDGHEYGWDVYAKDNSSAHLTSATSAHCWFDTDFTPPDTPAVADNVSFPRVGEGTPGKPFYAGPGVSTDFTVTAKDIVPDDTCNPNACLSSGVDHFLWSLDSEPTADTSTSTKVASTSGGVATATLPVPVTRWGVHTLYIAAVDKAGNISQTPASYTFNAPWNPATKVAPGDISGDGVPDLLATTSTGDLEMIPGDTDPAQASAPAQSGPLTGSDPVPAVTGPVIVSTAADAPTGNWKDYLVAHRGNLHGADVDDLFAYNTKTQQFYIVKNDFDPADDDAFPSVKYSNYAGYVGQHRYAVVTKEACEPADHVVDDSRCRTAGYDSQTWSISQLVTPGNVFSNPDFPAVITMENKRLWIYQADGGEHLKNPLLLGDGDWSGLDLIAPGTVGGTPTLWARDETSGTLYTFPLTLDGNGLPPLLHAPVRTALTSAVAVSGGGTLCLDDSSADTTNHNKIQIHTCNGTPAQQWSYLADGSLRVLGKCLDVTSGGVDNGTLTQLYTCNGTPAQKWTTGSGGSLVNPQSGKCLDDPSASTTNGTQVQIYTCNNTAAQNWTSTAAAGWNAHPGTPLAPVLSAADDPRVASPGDINSTDSGPDGNPDLYAVDSGGQLTEYPGAAPTTTTAAFGAPVSLGTAVNSSAHWWNLDEGTGVTAADQAAGLDASLTGAYSWATDSTRGKVLGLSGTTGYAATTGPAVNTSQSFTVSAWVKLNSLSANSTFVSQSDDPSVGAANGFQLYYSSGAQVWAFNRHNADDPSNSFSAAYGTKAVTGKWTHLVGVFDADAGKLSLYVNGSLSATKDYAGTSWNATGPVQIGRRLYQSSYAEYANAQISDVRIWNTALPPADAAAPGDNPRVSGLS
jgi:hypothetical protein